MLTVNSSSSCIVLQARHLGAGPLSFSLILESRLVGFYCGHLKEAPVLLLSVLVLLVPFLYISRFAERQSRNFQQQTRPRRQLKTADATDYCSLVVRHMLSNVHVICLHNSLPEFFTKSTQPQEGLFPISNLRLEFFLRLSTMKAL